MKESCADTDVMKNSLAAVDAHVLWHNTPLQHALLGVVATTAEQTGRLNLEVADLLLVAVDDAETKFFHNGIIGFLDLLSDHSAAKKL
jgi:hypothetical protein